VSTPEQLEGAVRAWAVPDSAKGGARPGKSGYVDLGPSDWTLTFDTETTTDPGQALGVGAYQLHRRGRLRKEGLFYNPATLTDADIESLGRFASEQELELLDRDAFAENIFLDTIYRRRGMLIGHNLPFDLFRISVAHEPARGQNQSLRGGFTLAFSQDARAPRIQVKRTSPGAAFFHLTIPTGAHAEGRNRRSGGRSANHHGYFLDTATLGGALFGGRPSLKGLSKLLDTPSKKARSEGHGEELSDDYLEYLRADVRVTWQCADALRSRYAGLGLAKSVWKIYSEASVGKAHLEQMEIRGWHRSEFPDPLVAAILETYHGGRTEAKIRKTPVPGVYVDFKSQYPSAFVLQDLWRFVIADRITWKGLDVATVQDRLDSTRVDAVLDPQFWKGLGVLVLVAPDHDRLPTRAGYKGAEGARSNYNVAVGLRTGGSPVWVTLADAVASALHTGKAPRVLRAVGFEAQGAQRELLPVDIGGDPRYRVDPYEDDFIRRLVELRSEVKEEQQLAADTDEIDRAARLESMQRAMKATANSIAYGTGIEINVIEHRKLQAVTVHLPDGGSYPTKGDRTERPGNYFNPLLATLVTGGGRLLLATAMALVDRAGGEYAYCDTDSLFIVATPDGGLVPCRGGAHFPEEGQGIRALSWETVDDLVGRFVALNPYDPGVIGGSILEIEDENLDPATGEQRVIECFAIASKRAARFVRGADGRPELTGKAGRRSRSEHGLGHLLPPVATSEGADWMDTWWEHLLCRELGVEDEPPPWFGQPAVGRITVTSPREERAFREYNAGRTYDERVKPWSFMSVAHPTATERARAGSPRTLIAPFELDAERRKQMEWRDRSAGGGAAYTIRVDSSPEVKTGSVVVQSYGDYFAEYRRHPERKFADPDGKPCHPWSRGKLSPRHVRLDELKRIGKESNRLAETALPIELDEHAAVVYREPLLCRGCGDPLLGRQRMWCSETCRIRCRSRAPVPSELGGPGNSSLASDN
jgi:hypothetical protein